jgi:competence protein ComEC
MSQKKIIPAKILLTFNLIFVIGVFVIGFIPDVFNKEKNESELIKHYDENLSFEAFVCEEADVDYKSRRLVLCVSSKVLITANLYPEYDYGDYLKISGKLLHPEKIEDFDYETYLARYDIYSLMYYPKIEKLEQSLNLQQKIFRKLLNFKQGIKRTIDSYLPEPESGLADAILLGFKRTVRRENLEAFSKTGLSHLIAISGSHITIMSALLSSFLLALGFKRKFSFRAILSFLVFYPAITGFSASAIRSSIMGGLAFIAIFNNRLPISIYTLLFAASTMLLVNPKLLRDDIGFQLSFLAILGIVYLYPYGEYYFKKFLLKKNIKYRKKRIANMFFSAFNLTIVSQIMTLPILLINFKSLSLVSPLANVLVAWVFAPLLALLIIASALSALLPTLGSLFFLPAYLILRFIFLVTFKMAAWPYASLTITNVAWGFGAIYYLCLFILIGFCRKKLPVHKLI